MLCAVSRAVESLSGTNRSMNAVTAMVAMANQMKSLMTILKTSSCSHTLMLSPQYHFGGMVKISSDHRPRMEIMMPDTQLRRSEERRVGKERRFRGLRYRRETNKENKNKKDTKEVYHNILVSG